MWHILSNPLFFFSAGTMLVVCGSWGWDWTLAWGFFLFGVLSVGIVFFLIAGYAHSQPTGFKSKIATLLKLEIPELEQMRWSFLSYGSSRTKGHFMHRPSDCLPKSDSLIVSFAGAALKFGGHTTAEFMKTLSTFECDQLYVYDPQQSFYLDDVRFLWKGLERWEDDLSLICSKYKKVLFIGASMGASAAVLYSKYATAVIAFNPILDFEKETRKSFRVPLFYRIPVHIQAFFKEKLLRSITAGSTLYIHHSQDPNEQIHSQFISHFPNVHIRVHPGCTDHHLPSFLKNKGELIPLIKKTFDEMK